MPSHPTPESIQEDIHTRSLLFPDINALCAGHDQVFPLSTISATPSAISANAYDYDGDIDLDLRDVRILIMQDSLGSVNPSLLFDSHPVPPVSSAGDRNPTQTAPPQNITDPRRVPRSPRKGSIGQPASPLVIQPGSPQPRQGAFDRRSSIQGRTYTYVETETQRAAREYREELASFSSCIFANTEVMSYKGTSTKVHIVPCESRSSDISSSYVGDGRGSMGRSSARTSRLAQSYTSGSANPPVASSTAPARQAERKKVLVTRLFPVNLPNDDLDTPISEDGNGFPFPYSLDDQTKKKKPHPKQKRTPMYAVALVLQLPQSTNLNGTGAKPIFRGSSSYSEQQDAFPSSFGSARRSGWTMVGSGLGHDPLESTYSNDVEDRMDAITQHWDVIMRSLTQLQCTVATTLFPMLKQADLATADPYPTPAQIARSASLNSRRGSDPSQMKPPKTNAKLVALSPNCLMNEQRINNEVGNARIRIVSGLRATRVVTGQGRWGPWREEARWVAKWAGGKEQGFFFFNLLTGFLATHQEWLQALSPIWYRKRHYQQHKAKNEEEDTALSSRTIIVASDKMAARRLVFLLAAFLPGNQQLPAVRPIRPVTSASFAAFGHSPPTFVIPMLREESLRRKMNRRTGGRGASHTRSYSIQSQATTRSATGIPAQLAHLSIDNQHERRPSDVTTAKPSNLPIAGSDLNTRKSSAATTNTITPDSAVPHFSTTHRSNNRRSVRPDSSGSTAADDLKRTLTRGESSRISHPSTSSHSRQSSRWGSVISGLWSTKRRESTSSISQPLEFSPSQDSPLASPIKGAVGKRDKLAEMVKEVESLDTAPRGRTPRGADPDETPDTPRRSEGSGFTEHFEPKARTFDPTGAFESPVKTSINNDDGVIDVDVPFPEYLTSFETAVSSPSSSGYLSTPGMGSGLDSFEQFSRVAIDGDVPQNVAGWLQRFHPDFTLQAIPPQEDLLDQVKEALMAEPTPAVHPNQSALEWPTERWVDVSTAIVADTTNFAIKRFRYRRLVKPKTAVDRSSGYTLTAGSSYMTPALSPYEQPIEDKIEVEDLVTLDEALIDAVERVIAQSRDVSKDTSATSSRSVSKRREGRRGSEASDMLSPREPRPSAQIDFHEVPRIECKTVILSALENIVQEVVQQRDKEGQRNEYLASREKESALRTAVRGWLESVEAGDS
ncbi:hypothetical protein SLS62_006525 [Diatrype stigma]|uniref:Folliculin-interacting protein N-terminal domain-containing protein n=1 Tax=Diatrype stigma TaxID=117547 RepID=A0AAN9UN43_9PEZI